MKERDITTDSQRPPSIRILISYISVFLIWGSTYLAIRIGVRDIPPALLAGTRFLVAGLIMVVFGRLTGRQFPSTFRDIRTLCVVGIFLLVAGNGLVVWSEQWIHSGLAAVIIATVPLFMSTIDSLIPGGHKLPPIGWLGIVIGFAGVVVLVSPSLGLAQGEQMELAGIVGLVLASFFWSIGSVYSTRNPVNADILVVTGIEMLAGGIVLTVVALMTGEVYVARATTAGLLSLLYLIIFGSIVGFTAYAYLLKHVPAAKASTYAYVNPIVAVILGAILLSEPIDLRTILATLIILGGVGLVQLARTRE